MVKVPKAGQFMEINGLWERYGELQDTNYGDYAKCLNGRYKIVKVDYEHWGDSGANVGSFNMLVYVVNTKEFSVNRDTDLFLLLKINDGTLDLWQEHIKLFPEGESSELLYA